MPGERNSLETPASRERVCRYLLNPEALSSYENDYSFVMAEPGGLTRPQPPSLRQQSS
jgi:hypothetical protein